MRKGIKEISKGMEWNKLHKIYGIYLPNEKDINRERKHRLGYVMDRQINEMRAKSVGYIKEIQEANGVK